jgi:tetratricopeptide (TPR) repeat protein
MEQREDRDSFIDRELRKKVDDSKVNYKTIESILFSRISEVQGLRELAVLKLDEMPTSERLDMVEHNLFSQITQYNEYEVPTNECISTEYDLSASQWDRLTTKIEERIHNSTAFPAWEQILMASECEPLQGEWESVEEALFERVCRISGQESWEQCTRLDEIHIQGSLDAVEMKLETRIREKRDIELWEYVVKTEKILSYHCWEKIEESLFSKLKDSDGTLPISKQPFWQVIDYYLLIARSARVASVVVLLMLMVVGGYFLQQKLNTQIPTLVYQLQGNATENSEINRGSLNENYNSVDGGSVSLVNSHGLVELQNGSDIKVDRLTKQHAWYKVGFEQPLTKGEIARGRASFLVNPHHGKETFRVQTPDYQIVVKGTFFKVEPDLDGRVSTRVLEGEIKVVSKLFKDTVVKAGESLVYDPFANEYKIQNGGTVVQRKEIESVPNVDELQQCKPVTIRSSVTGSDVRIDGRYFGTAPLTIRQSVGAHRIWIGKNGYVSVDTLIRLSDEDTTYSLDIWLNAIQTQEKLAIIEESRVKNVDQKVKNLSPESVANQLLGNDKHSEQYYSSIDSLYSLAQAVESKGNWKEAITLYQSVFDNPDVSRLRKEDALFSIGKLNAEHELVKTEARQTFLTYLALYPGGFFAGETWLRLAELEFKTNPENAVQYYLKYFEMFPRHPRISELQNRVGVIYLQKKKYDEAISLFRQALSNMISPSKGERENVSSNLHRALEAKGDSKSADTVLRQYILNLSEDK